MNLALDAVRYAKPAAFTDTPGMASKSAKRSLLRHLADLAGWSCEVTAYLQDRAKPKCDHASCQWTCWQSEVNTADELSISESAVKRTRRALVADGWITLDREGLGRGSATFYTLNKEKLFGVMMPKHEKRCKLPPFLRELQASRAAGKESISLPFTEEAQTIIEPVKPGSLPPLRGTESREGVQPAHERGADCSKKGCSMPLLNKKNPLEPSTEPKAISIAPYRASEAELERIYFAFPRQTKKPKALQAIRTALQHLASGKDMPPLTGGDALVFLYDKVTKYAQSPAGNAGEFTPHPSNWFNQQQYMDDEREWQHGANQANPGANRGQNRVDSMLEALKRANAADSYQEPAGAIGSGTTGDVGGSRTPRLLKGA